MNGKTKGINILSEEEKTEYRCDQGNFKLDFLDLRFDVIGGGDGVLCWNENKCDRSDRKSVV